MDAKQQSRWIKVRAYEFVRDDCLFIDADTLFVRPLNFSDEPVEAVGAALNLDGVVGISYSTKNWVGERHSKCGWEWSGEWINRYLNSGVILYRRGVATERFVSAWVENWEHFRRSVGERYDQPAFNRTCHELKTARQLSTEWNAPVAVLPQTARGARIFHYYASAGLGFPAHTVWGRLLAEDAAGGVGMKRLRAVLASGKPFVGLGATSREYRLARQWSLYAMVRAMKSVKWVRRRLLSRLR